MPSATTETADGPQTGRAGRLNRTSFGLVTMLVIQFVLGTAYNIYGTAPTTAKPLGMFSSPLLAIHVLFGFLLILAAIDMLVRAIRASVRLAIVTSIIGLVAIVAAAGAGGSFAGDGANGASFGMGLATGVAMICYALNLRAPRKG